SSGTSLFLRHGAHRHGVVVKIVVGLALRALETDAVVGGGLEGAYELSQHLGRDHRAANVHLRDYGATLVTAGVGACRDDAGHAELTEVDVRAARRSLSGQGLEEPRDLARPDDAVLAHRPRHGDQLIQLLLTGEEVALLAQERLQ